MAKPTKTPAAAAPVAKKGKQLPPPPPESESSDDIDEDDILEELEDEEDFEDEEGMFMGDEEEEGEEFEEDDLDFDDMDDDDDEDDGVDDDEDFERKAAKMKQKLVENTRLAAEESALQRAAEAKATPLADLEAMRGEDDEIMAGLMPSLPLEELEERIKETIRVLSNFKAEREEGRTRDEYLALLRQDFMAMFEYNDYLMDTIMEMFAPQEAFEFMEAMEKPRPTTIRTNTIKCKRRDLVQILTKRGVNVEPLEKWSKVGLQIFDSNVPIAGTVEYLAGHYMLQSAVSFLPVMALAPQENERVLDMAAAPGGKTTYIAQLMKNTGVLFANDVSEPRIKSLNANIQRLGVSNCIVTNYDGVGYDKIMKNFDRILIDAPCTGSGIISRDKTIKSSKTLADVQRASQLQRRMLLSAIDCTKNGGYIVYSTCSFLVEENESVVDYALRRRHVEVVEMGLPFGRPGYTKFRQLRLNAQVAHSRRFFPHVHNMDGFYVCKLRKIKSGPIEDANEEPEEEKPKRQRERKTNDKGAAAAGANKKKAAAANTKESTVRVSVPPKGKRGAHGTPAAKKARTEGKKGKK